MLVSVIGLGYIGLPTAALLARAGTNVIGIDINNAIVEDVNRGNVKLTEPKLNNIVKNAVVKGYLRATKKYEKADVFIIAVPTPFKNNHKPDLSYIESAVKSIAPILEKNNIIILESTSPVGTTEKIINWMKEIRPDLKYPVYNNTDQNCDLYIAHCPERVLPGNIIKEFSENDRIIGGVTKECAIRVKNFFKKYINAQCIITDCRTAELSKLTENAFRDVNIAFANEISLICNDLDINVWELISLANHHPRVNILNPGPGVGGHCLAVDPWFIIDSSPDRTLLIKSARKRNDLMPSEIIKKVINIVNSFDKEINQLNIAIFGLAFKPNIDDLRESPALEIAQKIVVMGFEKSYIVEPNIKALPPCFELMNAELVGREFAVNNADIIILLVDHSEFKDLDENLIEKKQVLDTRGILSRNKYVE
jgi:UDP-N-acetyl-D-mannosaminuronic acid dehydrogenase